MVIAKYISNNVYEHLNIKKKEKKKAKIGKNTKLLLGIHNSIGDSRFNVFNGKNPKETFTQNKIIQVKLKHGQKKK